MLSPTSFLSRVRDREGWISARRDFWKIDRHADLPAAPGIYILFGHHRFTYPRGDSPVFYIGQASSLIVRLRTHHYWATQAKDTRKLAVYWPRYEYAVEFGKWYITARTWQNKKPKGLEDDAMAAFAHKFGAFPVANGAGSWKRINQAAFQGEPGEEND